MKNLILIKSKKKSRRKQMIVLILITLFLSGCYDFENVDQPYIADPNSSFDVQISVLGGSGWDIYIQPYFGVLLPIGWTINDSLRFIETNYLYDTGVIIHSESLSQQMTSLDPPPENYFWWVGMDSNYHTEGVYFMEFEIYTDVQTGTFFLDYMLGSVDDGLNVKRSNEHLIIIGEVFGCLPEGITFTTQEEIDNFQVNYPNCTEIAGHVTINGEDITNLNGLDQVTSIGGSLRINYNSMLTSLEGLDQL